MKTALAATLYDPEGRMRSQAERVLPLLCQIFEAVFVRASTSTHPRMLEAFREAGALIDSSPAPAGDGQMLGLARREALAMAAKKAPFLLYCDADRALHWAERYPHELALAAEQICERDFTVLGRTERAFQTHPAVQRDTERIINHVFQLVSGWDWDVGAGARGLSAAAAHAILAGCMDQNLSTDVSWPLYLRSLNAFSLGYLPTEGLEFETPDRFANEVADAGGLEAWLKRFDSDPQRWLERLELAGGHLRAMLEFYPSLSEQQPKR